VQVTKHTSGSLFWPSMSGDGKTIVYEESFGLWKLDVASGRTTEIKIAIATDDKENEFEVATVQNEVDSFDLSPSGQRAVISARGQLFTIATTRGDITRIAPDPMASRNQQPKWSADGKTIAYLSDKSGRDEIWVGDPEGKNLKQITNLDNEKGAFTFTPDSTKLIYSAADKKLYSYSIADAKTPRSHRTRSRASARSRCRPTANGSPSRSRIGRCARTSTSRPSAAARKSTSRTMRCSSRKPIRSGPPTAAIWSSRHRKASATASPLRAASRPPPNCGRCRFAIRIAIR
jgi:Tol biopolymer transport system component